MSVNSRTLQPYNDLLKVVFRQLSERYRCVKKSHRVVFGQLSEKEKQQKFVKSSLRSSPNSAPYQQIMKASKDKILSNRRQKMLLKFKSVVRKMSVCQEVSSGRFRTVVRKRKAAIIRQIIVMKFTQ